MSWWRVVASDGTVWRETSDEAEARDAIRPGDVLERQWVTTVHRWVTATDEPCEFCGDGPCTHGCFAEEIESEAVAAGQPSAAELMDALETAWTIIANSGGGDWHGRSTEEWVEAAERFRDKTFHPLLSRWVANTTEVAG